MGNFSISNPPVALTGDTCLPTPIHRKTIHRKTIHRTARCPHRAGSGEHTLGKPPNPSQRLSASVLWSAAPSAPPPARPGTFDTGDVLVYTSPVTRTSLTFQFGEAASWLSSGAWEQHSGLFPHRRRRDGTGGDSVSVTAFHCTAKILLGLFPSLSLAGTIMT